MRSSSADEGADNAINGLRAERQCAKSYPVRVVSAPHPDDRKPTDHGFPVGWMC